MSKKIGFVGLGTMGFPMAVNLKKAGFEVIGFDGFKGVYEKARATGITMVNTLKEVAEHADEAMISMVRDYAQNVDVIFGENGLLSEHAKGKTIIVMSTLDPDSMNELGKKVEKESDLRLISAAVSGGASGAQAGTLSIMTSGPEDIVKSFQPYFDAILIYDRILTLKQLRVFTHLYLDAGTGEIDWSKLLNSPTAVRRADTQNPHTCD